MKNKIAIISGGASGMGEATAKLLVEKGCFVYVLDLNKKYNEKNICYMKCDISNFQEVKKCISEIKEKEKKIDYLFTAAGYHINGFLEDIEIEEFDSIMKTNVYGVYYVLKEVLPIMKKNKKGSIVLMGSDQSVIGKPKNCVYGSTKGAVNQMVKGLAIDLAHFNIRVNSVLPGTIDTNMFRKAIQKSSKNNNIPINDIIEECNTEQPIPRIGNPKEVANVVHFLLSDLSSYITGASISVDGGFTAQ